MSEKAKAPHIVLIGGSGRSGTNITKQLLELHSSVHAMPFETRFTVDPDGLVDFYNSFSASWSPYMADVRLKRLRRLLDELGSRSLKKRTAGALIKVLGRRGRWLSPRRYYGWRLADYFPNYKEHVTALMDELVDFSYPAAWVGTDSYAMRTNLLHSGPRSKTQLASIMGSFINALARDCLDKSGRGLYIEDNTWNILFARELLEFTPQAKLLHIVRDPRDVVASLIQQRWAPPTASQAAYWLNQIMSRWFDVRKTLPKASFRELSLEDLVADPKKNLGAICNFLDIDFEEPMLELDLSHANSGRWKAELSTRDAKEIQAMLTPILKEYGYDKS